MMSVTQLMLYLSAVLSCLPTVHFFASLFFLKAIHELFNPTCPIDHFFFFCTCNSRNFGCQSLQPCFPKLTLTLTSNALWMNCCLLTRYHIRILIKLLAKSQSSSLCALFTTNILSRPSAASTYHQALHVQSSISFTSPFSYPNVYNSIPLSLFLSQEADLQYTFLLLLVPFHANRVSQILQAKHT